MTALPLSCEEGPGGGASGEEAHGTEKGGEAACACPGGPLTVFSFFSPRRICHVPAVRSSGTKVQKFTEEAGAKGGADTASPARH